MKLGHLDDELRALRHVTSQARSAVARVTWRQQMQMRSTRMASIVRMLPRIVPGQRVSRVKVDGRWIVSPASATTGSVVLTITTRTPARRVEDLATPFPVRVERPELVDLGLLRQLAARGMVTLVDPS